MYSYFSKLSQTCIVILVKDRERTFAYWEESGRKVGGTWEEVWILCNLKFNPCNLFYNMSEVIIYPKLVKAPFLSGLGFIPFQF